MGRGGGQGFHSDDLSSKLAEANSFFCKICKRLKINKKELAN